jgi:hypothetical protein
MSEIIPYSKSLSHYTPVIVSNDAFSVPLASYSDGAQPFFCIGLLSSCAIFRSGFTYLILVGYFCLSPLFIAAGFFNLLFFVIKKLHPFCWECPTFGVQSRKDILFSKQSIRSISTDRIYELNTA